MKLPVLSLVALAALAFLPTTAGASEQIEAGRAVYNFRCYFCHGYSGDGKTLAASYLAPRPTDFTRADPAYLTPARIVEVLRQGKPGTAMKPFTGIVSETEMQAVAAFVADEFVKRKAPNTQYHTLENGWPDHQRYQAAFPFAKGEIPLSRPWENLTPQQSEGKRLYLASCVSCHDRGAPTDDDITWDSRPLSFPRNNFSLANAPKPDAIASASPYAKHDIPPKVKGMNPLERRGERLFQQNCAFCHGADGTGQNWIGKFMEPHPRNLRDINFMSSATRQTIRHAIREGLPNTSMPAWKDVFSERDIQSVVAYINRAFYPLRDEGKAP
ncbi:MAG: cytochrome c [Rhodocyclales bacterium GT-UBC]|nr:MAG: cytochrome c [Rhodocyclales bacterium GT-UBC]